MKRELAAALKSMARQVRAEAGALRKEKLKVSARDYRRFATKLRRLAREAKRLP